MPPLNQRVLPETSRKRIQSEVRVQFSHHFGKRPEDSTGWGAIRLLAVFRNDFHGAFNSLDTWPYCGLIESSFTDIYFYCDFKKSFQWHQISSKSTRIG